jgi:hypothetical protein
MLLMPVKLRLEAADGSGAEEYRIQDGDIEVRRLRRPGEACHCEDDWQRLTPGQLSRHVHDNTVVAQWLRHRIGWRRLVLACADHETLNRFDVAESFRDQFAA